MSEKKYKAKTKNRMLLHIIGVASNSKMKFKSSKMQFNIITILLLFTIPLFSQKADNSKDGFDSPTEIKSVRHSIKVNTIQPIGLLVTNRGGKGFDLQYEFPINTSKNEFSTYTWKNKFSTNKEKQPAYFSLNIRAFYSFLYVRNQHEATATRSYEKIGFSTMIKKYKNADRSKGFVGFLLPLLI
ncbi:MAG: hypothetical protein ACI9XB_000723 [Gammaproteobacteria bacterium]